MATAVAPRIFKNFINGEWIESRSGKAYENRNPANAEELVGMFVSSTEEDANAAVDAAREAYKSWRLLPAPKRAEILFRAAELLVRRKEEFSKDMTREMGKVLAETRGDVQEAIDMTYYMAGEGRRLFGQTTHSELAHKFAMSVRQSGGVCAMITPWNFPMAIPSWKIMPALISGNTVVIKPAQDTPLSVYNLVQVLTEAGVPRGVLNLVGGSGSTVGAALAGNPDVPVISFTGSTEVGRVISKTCAPDFKHCSLEMGGKNLILVMASAELGKNENAKLLTGGNRLDAGDLSKGWFHAPTVFGDCSPNMRIAQEEIFGPVVSVIPIHSLDEAIEVANGVAYGLSASIYTRNVNRAFQAARDLYTGIVYVNAPTIGAETHLPFGGTKQTGNGHREAAIAAIDFFTEWKTIYIDYSDKLQRAQIDNA